MKLRRLAVALLALAVACACVRLGFWQLARRAEKHARNEEIRGALTGTPVPLRGADEPLARLRGRPVVVEGTYDETRHVLLAGRWRDDDPGVEVLTPLKLADGAAVLVDRGWMPAADATTARPESLAESGPRAVRGLIKPLPRGARGGRWIALPGAGVVRWSARVPDLDSLAPRFPYTLAPFVLRALPDSLAPRLPRRDVPAMLDETMHLSYALQWFAIAMIVLVGTGFAGRRAGRGA